MKPGTAVFSVARISCAPAGRLIPARGPIASITSSRIRMPASVISVIGVNARPAWIRMVDMAGEHRSGNASRHKTKRAPRGNRDARRGEFLGKLLGCRCHVDAGQLQRFAVHAALYGHVVSGMRCHFVLRVDHVHLLVRVVHEHVLGAVLLDALGRAVALAFFRALYSTLAIRNPASPRAICRHRECPREKRRCHCHCKSYFHDFPLQKSTAVFDPPGRPVAWHSDGPVSRLFLRPTTSYSYTRISFKKKGGFSGILPILLCS